MNASTSTHSLRNKIFCFIGPSGTGKSALANMIQLPKVVSYRTRSAREKEIDGVDGHFISVEEFENLQKQNLLIAEAKYAGNYYGITQGEILQLEDSPMIYIVDWDGVEKLKEKFQELDGYDPSQIVTIFINTPRYDLYARMEKDNRNKDEIEIRLNRAELDYASNRKCDYIIENLNGELFHTAFEISQIILKEAF